MKDQSSLRPELSIAAIKQYVYCPRIPYFNYVLNIWEPQTNYMKDGEVEHQDLAGLEEKRKYVLKKIKEANMKALKLKVRNSRLGIKGIIDMVIELRGKYIPIEFKLCKVSKYVPIHHKAQLTAYALAIEDTFGKLVNHGYIYYIESEELKKVLITDDLRSLVIKTIERIRKIITYGELPVVNQEVHKCVNCWYSKFCKDINVKSNLLHRY